MPWISVPNADLTDRGEGRRVRRMGSVFGMLVETTAVLATVTGILLLTGIIVGMVDWLRGPR